MLEEEWCTVFALTWKLLALVREEKMLKNLETGITPREVYRLQPKKTLSNARKSPEQLIQIPLFELENMEGLAKEVDQIKKLESYLMKLTILLND